MNNFPQWYNEKIKEIMEHLNPTYFTDSKGINWTVNFDNCNFSLPILSRIEDGKIIYKKIPM